MSRDLLRRAIALAIALTTVALAFSGCGRGAATNGAGTASGTRVLVLGFDGMDYALTKKLMDEGRLPNFSRLAKTGSFGPLKTAIPPQSPVAWSNFITGMDSGGHGIYDFIHRDPKTMLPFLSTSKAEGGRTLEIGKYQFPLTSGKVELLRRGRAFWEVLENHGVDTTVVRMPANYPPSGTAGRELSGMGTPDIVGTYGEFSFYTSKLFAFAGEDVSGGHVYEVDIYDGVIDAKLYGPDNPFLIEPEKLTSDFKVYLDPDDPVAKIVAGSEEVVLGEHEWSDWVPVEFPMIKTQAMHGMVRFYLRSVRPEFELYASPVNYDPMTPDAPISAPDDYATALARRTGRFYTQGMPEDTKALQSKVLTEDEFLEQSHIAGQEVIDQFPSVLEHWKSGFLFYYIGNVDQVSHEMWKVMDPEHPQYDPVKDPPRAHLIEDLYVELDGLVGQAFDHLQKTGGDSTLITMSDHGFTSWRRTFDLNAWLKEKGFLVVKDPNLDHDPGIFANVDWSHTRAYGLGMNALYINVRGREKNGIVPPEKREALMGEIAKALLAEIDPKTGVPAVNKAFKREEAYKDRGELEVGPDIIIGFAKGTRAAGTSALGAVGKTVLSDNTDDWTGDHEMDPDTVPGILLTSRPLKRPADSLTDLGQSVLAEFGIDEPIQPRKP